MPQTPARVGGRYELGAVLGRGGMADVRRAHDPVLGRDVAVKLLRAADAVDRTRFASEARLLALLTHENVVTVLDAGIDDPADGPAGVSVGDPAGDGLAWLALELVEGDTLADRFALGPIDPTALAELGAQVAAALRHAHGHGVVHRDVKPSNVLIDAAGHARLTDFGIARLVDDTSALTMTGHTIGTAAYLAPEQVAGEAVTTASDVYALGLLLLEGLTGRREYAGPPVEAALARLQRGPLVPVSLPTGWPGLIAAMTLRDPADRPTADEVAGRLLALRHGRSVTPPAQPPVQPPAQPPVQPPADMTGPTDTMAIALAPGVPAVGDGSPRRRRPVLLAVAAAVALVVALSALVLDGAPGQDAPPASAASAGPDAPRTPTRSATPTPRATTAATASTSPTATPTPAPVAQAPAAAKPQAKPKPGPGAKGGPKGKAKPKGKGKGGPKGSKPRGKGGR